MNFKKIVTKIQFETTVIHDLTRNNIMEIDIYILYNNVKLY